MTKKWQKPTHVRPSLLVLVGFLLSCFLPPSLQLREATRSLVQQTLPPVEANTQQEQHESKASEETSTNEVFSQLQGVAGLRRLAGSSQRLNARFLLSQYRGGFFLLPARVVASLSSLQARVRLGLQSALPIDEGRDHFAPLRC